MSESARVLPFRPRRAVVSLSDEAASAFAERFLETALGERSDDLYEQVFASPETLLSICQALRKAMNAYPKDVAAEVQDLYRCLSQPGRTVGLFDEREYLLGEVALIAGTAHRHLGAFEEAERWLHRAESAFRHTVNPAPMLANVAYARLALRYDQRRYDEVLEFVPSVISSFEKLDMGGDVAKARFLEAMTLKESGNHDGASQRFEALRAELKHTDGFPLLGMVLVEVGAARALRNRLGEALEAYEEAAAVLGDGGEPMTVAHLQAVIGETYRNQGNLSAAVVSLRAALKIYLELGMLVRASYLRVLVAETLIAAKRYREAEWEILAALPTIEEQKMVPEGFAAVALLKESVQRRKTDSNALRQLREHLQVKN